MTDKIEPLVKSVESLTTVVDSAIALIKGFSSRLQQAIDDALRNGATAAELEPLVALRTNVDIKTTELADAVAANT